MPDPVREGAAEAVEVGRLYTEDELEQEARRVHADLYPGYAFANDSSKRVVSYERARVNLSHLVARAAATGDAS